MKDYTINASNNSSNSFILNYTIADSLIIVNLASGRKNVFPYSIEKEVEILEQMRQQVLNSSDFRMNQEFRFSDSKAVAFLTSLMALTSGYEAIITFEPSYLLFLAAYGVSLFICSNKVKDILDSYSLIKDYEKNKMFVDNEKLIGDSLATYYSRRHDTKTKNIVDDLKVKKLTLNSIDLIKFKELKELVDTINKDKEEGSSYSELQDEKISQLIKKI